MELFSPKPKKVLIFFQEKILYFGELNFLAPRLKNVSYFSYISRENLPSSKNKKNHSEKNFLYFFQKNNFFYFGKSNFLASSLKNFLYFRRELSKLKKLKSKKIHSEKISYIFSIKSFYLILGNGLLAPSLKNACIFLYFWKKDFLSPKFEKVPMFFHKNFSYVLGNGTF